LERVASGFSRRENPALAQGVNIRQGKMTNPAVAQTFGLECVVM